MGDGFPQGETAAYHNIPFGDEVILRMAVENRSIRSGPSVVRPGSLVTKRWVRVCYSTLIRPTHNPKGRLKNRRWTSLDLLAERNWKPDRYLTNLSALRSTRPHLPFLSLSHSSRVVYPMDAERVLLSCPGRVQDWLGAAVDQIETLLHVPLPSLSGSDEAIGALRIKRKRPSRATGPYNLRSKNGGSGASPTTNWGSLSVSSDELLCAEKSPSRCENCVAEKGSRCSRDLPSCSRCHKNGMFCSYLEGAPAGCRKPQGRRRERSHISERGSGLPGEPLSATPVSGIPASGYPQPSLEQHLTVSPVNSPTGVSSVTALTKHQCQTAAVKRQVTMLPATPTISTPPLRTSKLEAPLEGAGAEPDVVANGLRSSLVTGR